MIASLLFLLHALVSVSVSLLIAWPFIGQMKRHHVLIGLAIDSGLRCTLLSIGLGHPCAWSVLVAFIVFSHLAWIDACTGRLPDILTLPMLAAGIARAAWVGHPDIANVIMGASVGFLILFSIDKSWRALYGQHAIGGGDMKLLAALGAWSGIHTLLLLLSCACLMAACVGLLTTRHRLPAAALPFGPFLVIAALLQQLLIRHWAPTLI